MGVIHESRTLLKKRQKRRTKSNPRFFFPPKYGHVSESPQKPHVGQKALDSTPLVALPFTATQTFRARSNPSPASLSSSGIYARGVLTPGKGATSRAILATPPRRAPPSKSQEYIRQRKTQVAPHPHYMGKAKRTGDSIRAVLYAGSWIWTSENSSTKSFAE